ncbi:MAG: redoxin domain-containing protein [Rhodopirellula sp.]|nr:redoxin domain-containing protein [Rhodopirellula sp.]
MRLRILILPLAAAVISGLVWYKLQQNPARNPTSQISVVSRLQAPSIEALDQDNSITRLKSFQGRHNLLVVFFDGEAGAETDSTLRHLKQHADELKAADYHVIAISSALPQQNRKTDFPPLFHLITDPAPIWKIHRDWGSGCFDKSTGTPRTAVFHIDRAGNVTGRSEPVPLEHPDQQIDALLGLSHENVAH